jgi:hypothetical protein
MGGWKYQGKDSHNTPMIIRFGHFGPSEGGLWECVCGKTHTIVKVGNQLHWDWQVERARDEVLADLAEEQPLGSADNPINIMAKVVPLELHSLAVNLSELIDGYRHTDSDVRHIEAVLRKLEDWGYIRFEAAKTKQD